MFKNLFCLIFLFSYLFPLMANTPGDYNEGIKNYTSNLPFQMGEIKAPVFRDKSFNIRDFGAVPDGYTLNTEPINNAITKCSEDGGGIVIIPAGLWITGPIFLKSNVNLHADRGALVILRPAGIITIPPPSSEHFV